MILIKRHILSYLALASMLFVVVLSAYNSMQVQGVSPFAETRAEQPLHAMSPSCKKSMSDHCSDMSHVDQQHDHSDCSELHCGGFMLALADDIPLNYAADQSKYPLAKQQYASISKPTPYIPPIVRL